MGRGKKVEERRQRTSEEATVEQVNHNFFFADGEIEIMSP